MRGITGPVEARMTTVKRMQIVRVEMPNVELIVGGNEPGGGTMGLLGRNTLSIADAGYDLAHGATRFLFPDGDCDGQRMAYGPRTPRCRRSNCGATPLSVCPR